MCAGMAGFGKHEVVTPKTSAGALDMQARAQLAVWVQGGHPPPASMLTHLWLPALEVYVPPKLLSK